MMGKVGSSYGGSGSGGGASISSLITGGQKIANQPVANEALEQAIAELFRQPAQATSTGRSSAIPSAPIASAAPATPTTETAPRTTQGTGNLSGWLDPKSDYEATLPMWKRWRLLTPEQRKIWQLRGLGPFYSPEEIAQGQKTNPWFGMMR